MLYCYSFGDLRDYGLGYALVLDHMLRAQIAPIHSIRFVSAKHKIDMFSQFTSKEVVILKAAVSRLALQVYLAEDDR